jgi:hypothetical protein
MDTRTHTRESAATRARTHTHAYTHTLTHLRGRLFIALHTSPGAIWLVDIPLRIRWQLIRAFCAEAICLVVLTHCPVVSQSTCYRIARETRALYHC